ncbi:vir protein [Legionella quinlivanii]|uniref:Vir protein n=1 Tax=Legionella quinlivanii TaxID=45073 RepID=A0A0W0XUJ8_9GAMM|nr:type IV secretion system protein [Legionella quinlivanii]KTD47891.1 vir protein [Legionella quinlivanii]SEG37241.1 type IV secretion system protein VirB6 [Legionella quinlivanii DSM 21216]STY10115.1 protein LvhB6 [Legionella quinlivanii]
MESPTYANLISQLTGQIDAISKTFVMNGYQALANHLEKPLASACVFALVLMGFGIMMGFIRMPSKDLMKLALRIGGIYLFAMNWGFFSEYFVGLFVNGASELGGVLMKANLSGLSVDGVNSGLQSVLNEVVRVGAWTWDKASFKHWSPIFVALMIYLSGLAVIGLALFELIIAKLMLAVCLSTAPIFILFTLFDVTKSFFERWIGVLVGFSLILVFVSSVASFCMRLIHWAVYAHYANHALDIGLSDWIPIVLVAAFCVMALLEVTAIAKSIGASCSTSNGAAMLGGFVGGAIGASRKAQDASSKSQEALKQMVPASAKSPVQVYQASRSPLNLQSFRG